MLTKRCITHSSRSSSTFAFGGLLAGLLSICLGRKFTYDIEYHCQGMSSSRACLDMLVDITILRGYPDRPLCVSPVHPPEASAICPGKGRHAWLLIPYTLDALSERRKVDLLRVPVSPHLNDRPYSMKKVQRHTHSQYTIHFYLDVTRRHRSPIVG